MNELIAVSAVLALLGGVLWLLKTGMLSRSAARIAIAVCWPSFRSKVVACCLA